MLGERLEGRKGPKARIGLMMDGLVWAPRGLYNAMEGVYHERK
jgi:hypothetical protein